MQARWRLAQMAGMLILPAFASSSVTMVGARGSDDVSENKSGVLEASSTPNRSAQLIR